MKPPSSDSEALRSEETAQVRASNGLFVAANELRHLERGHQPIRQPVGRVRRLRRRLRRRRSMRRFRVRRLPHRYPPHACGQRARGRSMPNSVNEPSQGMCGGRTIGLKRSARAADSVGGIQSAALNARPNRRQDGGRCVADVPRHRTPHDRAERHLVPRSRVRRFTMGFTGPWWCARKRVGVVPTALRSRVALSAVAVGPKPSALFWLRPFQPFRSWCFLPWTCGPTVSKRSTGFKADLKPTWRRGSPSPREMLRAYENWRESVKLNDDSQERARFQ